MMFYISIKLHEEILNSLKFHVTEPTLSICKLYFFQFQRAQTPKKVIPSYITCFLHVD